MVVKAYRKVKQGGKAAGIDGESWKEFEQKGVEKQLYVIWNRMASGSYFPQPVKEIEIPKKDGRKRKLGIPTIRDRIAQQVVKEFVEQLIDAHFHPNSYGYRPMKSGKEAIAQVRENCLQFDWVVDMDISKFFDEISHELMLKAIDAMKLDSWVKMYVQRWLEMKIVKSDGTIYDRGGKGTPQGGVISPLLANLFLHYGLDKWLEKNYPETRFVRYADDAVVHCRTKEEAEQLLAAIKARMEEIGLRLNETKTKIVYCKDYRRKQDYEQIQFGFLGFSFQPRQIQSGGNRYMGFTAEISKDNQKKIRESIRETINWRNTEQRIDQIAGQLNRKLRGWINYFGLYGKHRLRRVMFYLEEKLVKWLAKKHKQGKMKSVEKLKEVRQQNPTLFHHWERGYS
jgi:group II intron reverse transcriptase/maturase